jgi:hypothetical protein
MSPAFNPYILGKDEIMLSQGMMDYFQLQTGDSVTVELDISAPEEKMKLLNAMHLMSHVSNGNLTATHALILTSKQKVAESLTVAASYDNSNGKFPSAYGNVLLFDCHHVFSSSISILKKVLKPYAKTNPKQYALAIAEITLIER